MTNNELTISNFEIPYIKVTIDAFKSLLFIVKVTY